jgi:outer membrane receptor protein involved in Fe transport
VFARDMLKLTPKLSVTASLSYTFTHIDLAGSNTTLLDDSGAYTWVGADGSAYYNPAYLGAQSWDAATGTLVTAGIPDGALAGPEVDPVVGAHSYSRVNPALGATWNPRVEIGLFANYGEAMRAPTAIELTCANPAQPCALPTGFNGDPDLKAVIAHSLELGARGTIARHLAWNAAVYRTLVDNDIQFIYAASGLGYFANLGRTERQGFELGLTADWRLAPGRAIHLAANYGHVAATYRTAFLDANGDTVMPGNRIAGIPAQSLKLRVRYQPSGAIVLGANLVAVSGQYAHGDEANRQGQVPGYALVNLDASVTPRPRLELFGTMTNLFDRHYATFGVLGSNVYTGGEEQFRTPAPGRAVLGGLRYHFGGGQAAADAG